MKETLSRIIAATEIEDVWDIHTEAMANYGFDRLIYGFTRFATGATLGDLQDALILTNHDREYVDAYVGEGLCFNGPMIRWGLENVGACSWRMMSQMLESGTLSKAESEVVQMNISMGVVAGYSISFHDVSQRAKGAIGLTAKAGLTQDDVDGVWFEHGDDIELINNLMHLKVTQLPHTTGKCRKLTQRQREVLEWIADGKTVQDAAKLMGLNLGTVEKHLRLARESLNVDTTAQAVMKASSQNQFFLIQR